MDGQKKIYLMKVINSGFFNMSIYDPAGGGSWSSDLYALPTELQSYLTCSVLRKASIDRDGTAYVVSFGSDPNAAVMVFTL
jgi:hypothetical protein